jgi:DNA helicase-2/ATP-dependent DNA helicase PcrA
VALTRAQASVQVSLALERDTGKSALPSRLIESIDQDLLSPQEAPAAPPRLMTERVTPYAVLPDKAFLNELFVEQGLSVTALNNYLACPWNYFYSNLVRIPKMPSKHMLFGTAVHQALRRYFEARVSDEQTPPVFLVEQFVESAKKLPFNTAELEESVERGREFLTGWHHAREGTWAKDARMEYKITTELVLESAPVSSVRLRGDLDKLEVLSDGVRVIDYKTGKPKTRNAIMGLTKTDDGGYFRQLVFYKMLLELEGRYTFKDAVLDFVQPDDKGRYHQETFEVTEHNVAEMKATIQRATSEIYELSFWNTRCDDKGCEYCALRNLMG